MSALTKEAFEFVREVVFKHSAIALDADKQYLVETRLMKLSQKQQVGSVEEIVAGLRDPTNSTLRQKVLDVMTTNETSFFRDMAMFDALRDTILPEAAARNTGPLNIWCSACSSGQEPYSLLMLMQQHHPQLLRRTSLLATDLSTEMVAATQAGRYSQLEVNRGLPVALVPEFFDKEGLRWQIKDTLRRRVQTKQMNLATPWPAMPTMDIVLLRNVLIYFDTPTKKQVLQQVKRVLRPDGVLFLGAAETTLNLDPAFCRDQRGSAHCYRLA